MEIEQKQFENNHAKTLMDSVNLAKLILKDEKILEALKHIPQNDVPSAEV